MFFTRVVRGLMCIKDTVVAGLRLAGDGAVRSEVRTFDTTTPGLLAMSAWLAEHGCTHVAMEATGVYWKPVWHILSDRRLHADPGQRRPRQERAGTQD